jgi:hypothetical protein
LVISDILMRDAPVVLITLEISHLPGARQVIWRAPLVDVCGFFAGKIGDVRRCVDTPVSALYNA